MAGALVGASAKACREGAEGASTHVVEGDLADRVFGLVDLTDRSEPPGMAHPLCLGQFWRMHLGEHAKQKVQQQVSERLATASGTEDVKADIGLRINMIRNHPSRRSARIPC